MVEEKKKKEERIEWKGTKKKVTENRTIPDIGNFSSIIGNSIPQKECVASFHRTKKKKRRGWK